jgi:hypothetical protein
MPPDVRLVVLLAMVPHVRPQLLDVLWTRNEATGRGFTEFGGLHGAGHGGFVPTGETAVFLLAGDDLAERFRAVRLFEADALLGRHDLLRLGPAAAGEPPLTGALALSRDVLHRVTTGVARAPEVGAEFPARRIRTALSWEDLVLPRATLEQLDEIRSWILHSDALLHRWGLAQRLHAGFTSLFCGPPGTGKTLAASLLGKLCGCDVYMVDLALVVSKYVGETEKNLARVFDQAEHRRWILFFDEADALFGKRTAVSDAHDRFANQEVSFLLQRIEDFDGVVILASNLRANIDDAFVRRFSSVVEFPLPRSAERLRIWTDALPRIARLDAAVDLRRIADRYAVAGGTILNVVRYASLRALGRGDETIRLEDLEEGLRRELLKEGRAVPAPG